MGPTNIELEKGGAREGGAVELRFACGGTAELGKVEHVKGLRFL